MKYGDIIINDHASENNSHRKGVFVKSGKGYIMLADLNGSVWKVINDKESKFIVCGKLSLE